MQGDATAILERALAWFDENKGPGKDVGRLCIIGATYIAANSFAKLKPGALKNAFRRLMKAAGVDTIVELAAENSAVFRCKPHGRRILVKAIALR